VHRDIKPGNFLLANGLSLRVGDFGIARVAADETITGTDQLLGTAAYISPEQVVGHAATAASDRYALAVTAFELLTHERPFRAEHFAAQARQHLEDDPPRASERNTSLPRRLDAVLARGMAKRPEDRWPTAASFVDAIEDALTTKRATVPSGPFIATSTSSRGRWRASAIAALAGVAVAAGAVAGASQDGGGGGARAAHSKAGATTIAALAPRVHRQRPQPHNTPRATQTAAAATTQPTQTPSTPDALEARGHQLMVAGDYAGAISVLRQALAAASPGSLTYAYALYDLGRSLRLAGDPQEAIRILVQRLQIPNQTGAVRQELALASLSAGLGGAGAAAPPPGPPGQRPGKHGGDHGQSAFGQGQGQGGGD
jgi:serine/threonine-protein kinase